MTPQERLFHSIDPQEAKKLVQKVLTHADDGELYLEYTENEAITLEDGIIKTALFDVSQGFGLRAVGGEQVSYAHNSVLDFKAIQKAADNLVTVPKGNERGQGASFSLSSLYQSRNPLDQKSLQDKVAFLLAVDSYARGKDPKVKQVAASLSSQWKVVSIIRPDTTDPLIDIRPMYSFRVNVVVEGKDGRREHATNGAGLRDVPSDWLSNPHYQGIIDEALRMACVALEAVPAPAGEFAAILGNGWPGILLHEAVGHGLEGDFNRKKTSTFSDRIGQQVAARGVTVVDDGTLPGRRGSLNFDDEGTPTEKNVLIEDGILKGYMQDRQNARLMDMKPTGNGRRESYAHIPMPRMTNTFMTSGDHSKEEILAHVKDGIYAVNFAGGQVDITSGKFVFQVSEAYRVRNGQIMEPIKGAMLVGNGPETMKKITMIGNDSLLDPGIGTCGKNGQSVPVGVGQPTLLVSGITVGGTGR